MKRKVFISAGHSNVPGKDMGADGLDGLKEGQMTASLRIAVVKELTILGQHVFTDSDSSITKDTVTLVNALLDSRDIAIDLHFNAFAAESAKGCEVLIPFRSSPTERELAKILVDNISATLGTKNRGVRTEADSARKHLMFMTPNCENILIEVCFITNKADILMYLTKKDIVAKVIAKCIYDFVTKLN